MSIAFHVHHLHLHTALKITNFDDSLNKYLSFRSSLANGHITLNTPVLVRSLKLSSVEPSQYLDG